MSFTRLAILLFILIMPAITKAQQGIAIQQLEQFPERSINAINDKLSAIDKKLSRQTLKALKKFEKQQARLLGKLAAKDAAIKNNLAEEGTKLKQLQEEYIAMPDSAIHKPEGEYDAYMDTLRSAFKFLQLNKQVGSQSAALQQKLSTATAKLNILEGKLAKAEAIKKILRERKEILKQQLEKFGMLKQIKQIEKTAYYYSACINEYKTLLKDRKKLEKKAMALLYKIPAFKQFASEHSWLNSLFGQNSANTALSPDQLLQGIQSRAAIRQNLQATVAAGGPNVNQVIRQQMDIANAELDQLKNKINRFGGDGDMPATFKPNSQKVKRFKDRLEYGANLQLNRSSGYFPTTGDIAFSLSYKASDSKSFGIGAGYKVGLGKNIRNIKLSAEGISLRSFADIQLKGQFFISAGYEQNYLSTIRDIQQLKDHSAWVSSGLVGISKSYKANKKLQGKLQLLIDVLSHTHIPKTQTIIFRTGFTFK